MAGCNFLFIFMIFLIGRTICGDVVHHCYKCKGKWNCKQDQSTLCDSRCSKGTLKYCCESTYCCGTTCGDVVHHCCKCKGKWNCKQDQSTLCDSRCSNGTLKYCCESTYCCGTTCGDVVHHCWDRLSHSLSMIKELNSTNKDSLQIAINVTSNFMEELPEENEANALLVTEELQSFAIKYGKVHLEANESVVIPKEFFEMNIQRVLGINKKPITCSKGDTRESIAIPSENFKGKDTVVVCMHFSDAVKRWIPTRGRVEQKGKTIINFTIGNIVASKVDPSPQVILPRNVTIVFHYDEALKREDTAHCVYWDFQVVKPNYNGSWSNRGCSLVKRVKNEVTCSCNHLTNFAVLMQVGGDNENPKEHELALEVITYIGCALSLVGEVLTIIAYCVLIELKEDQTQIRFNLVVAIAMAQITFLAGINATGVKGVCVFIAAMIHYFYLVGFAWMFFEGVYLYLMVVKVFNTVVKTRLFSAVAWGLPLIIVLLSMLIASTQSGGIDSYVHGEICWVSFKNNCIWAFVTPVLVVCSINLVLLGRVVHEILKIQANKVSEQERIRQGVKACIVLFPLLGLTWVFGILSITDAGLVFQYIFTILNSLQGLFIFILHVLRNSDVRAAYSRKKKQWKTARKVGPPEYSSDSVGMWSSKVVNEPESYKKERSGSTSTTSVDFGSAVAQTPVGTQLSRAALTPVGT